MPFPVIKSSVTYLEMTENPKLSDLNLGVYEFILEDNPDVNEYLNLYREIGRDYIWNYRPGQTIEEIEKIINSSVTKLYYLFDEGIKIGLAECDFTDSKDIEVVHFGLLPSYINKGLGKKFFKKLLKTLWDKNPKRVYLSTCGMDHPKAVSFYQSEGFKIYKTKEAEFIDYRYGDFYNIDDAPQIPHGIIK